MAAQAISISISWAIEQYRQALSAAGMRRGAGPVRVPRDHPELTRYFRSIGLGRNIDAYA